MNDPQILDLEPIETVDREAATQGRELATTDNSPASMMMQALGRGANLQDIKQMLELQERWEAGEARKAYNVAFAAFKAEAVHIIKNKQVTDGPLKGKSYAELHAVVDALTPALSQHGLSASWKLTKDEKDWMEVTCTLRHVKGHEESVSMGGPPDAGGAKNAIQARASTKSYLERYTLKAICGVAEGGEDDDGAGGGASLQEIWVGKAMLAESVEDMIGVSKDGAAAFNKARDKEGYKVFAAAVQKRGAELRAKEAGNA
jgi:hypothetical protein